MISINIYISKSCSFEKHYTQLTRELSLAITTKKLPIISLGCFSSLRDNVYFLHPAYTSLFLGLHSVLPKKNKWSFDAVVLMQCYWCKSFQTPGFHLDNLLVRYIFNILFATNGKL